MHHLLMYAFVLGIIGGAAAGTDKSLSLKESMLSRKVLVHNQTSCPCKDPSLCNPIKTRAKKEVFAFIISSENYQNFDWSKMTTIVLFLQAKHDTQIMCYAHSMGVKVSYGVDFPKSKLTNQKARTAWVTEQVAFAKQHFMDGVNFDYESSMTQGDVKGREGLNSLVKELTMTFKAAFTHDPQVTFDVAYKPTTSRHYDYAFIGKTVDFTVIMGYDETGYCVTGANAGFHKTVEGVKGFLKLGIPAGKLVLGLPWYGYDYPCGSIDKDNKCTVSPKCKGEQMVYSVIMGKRFKYTTSGMLWDKESQTPFFSYKDPNTGKLRQAWLDNGKSLSIKYKWAFANGLLGIGMWRIDAIDNTDSKEGRKERQEMWGAVPNVKTR